MSKPRKSADAGYARVDPVEPIATEPEPEDNGTVQTTANGDAIYVPPAGGGAPAPASAKKPAETKSQRFRRLVNRRIPAARKALKALIPLANRAQYEYSAEDVDQIKEAIVKRLEQIARAFDGRAVEEEEWRLR